MLISLKNYDRALYELMRIITPVNDFSILVYKTLMGICLSHCFYYDLSVYSFCEGASFVRPLLDMYNTDDKDENKDKKERRIDEPKIKTKNAESMFCFIFYINLLNFFCLIYNYNYLNL